MKHTFAPACIAILVVSFAGFTTAQQLDANAIIQRSVEANQTDWKANPEYDWTERDLQPGGGTKTFQEFMILGSPYGRLIALDGKPLPAAKEREEQHKLDTEIAKRQQESPEARHQRVAKFEEQRSRDHVMMEQLTKAFNFKLIGQQKLNSHDVYVLNATPKNNYQPPNMQSQALKGMQGKLWIDKASFQWVKVEAEVVRPVSIEGFLAKVEPGTRFELEKAPVQNGIWLPSHYAMKSQARVLYLFSHKSRDEETYWNYHKSTEDSSNPGGQ